MADQQGILTNLFEKFTFGGSPFVVGSIGAVIAVFLISRGMGKPFMEVFRAMLCGGGRGVNTAEQRLDKLREGVAGLVELKTKE